MWQTSYIMPQVIVVLQTKVATEPLVLTLNLNIIYIIIITDWG